MYSWKFYFYYFSFLSEIEKRSSARVRSKRGDIGDFRGRKYEIDIWKSGNMIGLRKFSMIAR